MSEPEIGMLELAGPVAEQGAKSGRCPPGGEGDGGCRQVSSKNETAVMQGRKPSDVNAPGIPRP